MAPNNDTSTAALPYTAPAPDLTALTQPGPSAPVQNPPAQNQPTATTPAPAQAAAAPATTNPAEVEAARTDFENANASRAAAAKTAATPLVPPNAPHARLMNMIAALGITLSAAGTSLATHGREGGAPEVQQYYAQEQQQKIQQQQAAQAQKNAQVQQQLTAADTNQAMGQTHMLLATLPNEITKSDLQVQAAKQNLAGQAQGQAISQADFQAAHGGMTPEQFSAAISGTGPSATGAAGSFFTTRARQQLEAATKILGATDPFVQKLQVTLNNPQASPQELWTATNQLQSQIATQSAASTATSAAAKAKMASDSYADYEKGHKPGEDYATWQTRSQQEAKESTPGGQATVAKDRAQATAAEAQTRLLAAPPPANGKTGQDYINTLPPDQKSLVESLGNGQLRLSRWDYLLKSAPAIPEEVMAAYPDFNSSKIDAYHDAMIDFTKGPTSVKLESGATALKHLNELSDLNTAQSMVPYSPDWYAYQNKVNTVVGELVKFYGVPDTDSSIANAKAGLGATAQYARNRAIKTQAGSMADKFESLEQKWKNAIPSATFQSKMPTIDPNAKAALTRLDPNFVQSHPQWGVQKAASNYVRPTGVSDKAILMQAPGGQPHWIEPMNVKAAQNAGATEVQ